MPSDLIRKGLRAWATRRALPGQRYPAPNTQSAAAAMKASAAAENAQDLVTAAAECFRALRLSPASADIGNTALRLLRSLCRRGELAPARLRSPDRESGKISIVVCSHVDERFDKFRGHLELKFAGQDWELIRIRDASSMCDGYARGLDACNGELVVLCHDDIGFFSASPAEELRTQFVDSDIFGVAGTDRLESAAWWGAGAPFRHSWVARPSIRGGYLLSFLGGSNGSWVKGAQALDGMLVAARRSVLLQLGFDTERFDGFHFYDIDLTWRAFKQGWRTGIALNLGTWHASSGKFDEHWSFYGRRFMEKHPELRNTRPTPSLSIPFIEVQSESEHQQVLAWMEHFLDSDLSHDRRSGK